MLTGILKKALLIPLEILNIRSEADHQEHSRSWLKLGMISLLFAGTFSVVIVVARTPFIADLIADPLFARKSLVLHVVMALIVWFYAFLAVIYLALNRPPGSFRIMTGVKPGIIGLFLMIAALFLPGAEPVLANYIPVLDHPVFLGGLLFFFVGLLCTFSLNPSAPFPRPMERSSFFVDSAAVSIRFAGAVLLIALFTLLASWALTPRGGDVTSFYELVMWGGGHILQFANVLGMLTVWLVLVYKLTGEDAISRRTHLTLLWVLTLPVIASPLLLMQGTTSTLYYQGFTGMMRWFIFPAVTIYILIAIRAVWQAWRGGRIQGGLLRNLHFTGLATSILLTVIGFIIGAMIRGGSTLIPAHYHASLGGVTVAYMTMIFILMPHFGYSLKRWIDNGWAGWQPLLFGGGQAIFAVGFAYAGIQGTGRKLFGSDQSIDTLEAMFGLGLMSLGSLLAIAGGLLFIYMIAVSFNHKQKRKEP